MKLFKSIKIFFLFFLILASITTYIVLTKPDFASSIARMPVELKPYSTERFSILVPSEVNSTQETYTDITGSYPLRTYKSGPQYFSVHVYEAEFPIEFENFSSEQFFSFSSKKISQFKKEYNANPAFKKLKFDEYIADDYFILEMSSEFNRFQTKTIYMYSFSETHQYDLYIGYVDNDYYDGKADEVLASFHVI